MTKLYGDWDRTGKLLKLAPTKVTQKAEDALQRCAQMYLESVIETIDTDPLGWRPLTDKWVYEKERRGGELGFFRYSNEFVDKLEVRRVKSAANSRAIFVGASPYSTHKGHNSPMTMEELAYVLQFYYDRPLFEPAWERVKDRIEEELAKVGENLLE